MLSKAARKRSPQEPRIIAKLRIAVIDAYHLVACAALPPLDDQVNRQAHRNIRLEGRRLRPMRNLVAARGECSNDTLEHEVAVLASPIWVAVAGPR